MRVGSLLYIMVLSNVILTLERSGILNRKLGPHVSIEPALYLKASSGLGRLQCAFLN